MHSENTTYGFSLGTPAFECILNRRTLLSGHGAEMKIEPPWAIWNLFCAWTLGEAYWLETALSLVCFKQNIQASGLINRKMWDEPVSSEKLFFWLHYNHSEVIPPSSSPPHPPHPPTYFKLYFKSWFGKMKGKILEEQMENTLEKNHK